MTVVVIVLVALGVWMLGSILLGAFIGRGIAIAERNDARTATAGQLRKSGLSAAA